MNSSMEPQTEQLYDDFRSSMSDVIAAKLDRSNPNREENYRQTVQARTDAFLKLSQAMEGRDDVESAQFWAEVCHQFKQAVLRDVVPAPVMFVPGLADTVDTADDAVRQAQERMLAAYKRTRQYWTDDVALNEQRILDVEVSRADYLRNHALPDPKTQRHLANLDHVQESNLAWLATAQHTLKQFDEAEANGTEPLNCCHKSLNNLDCL